MRRRWAVLLAATAWACDGSGASGTGTAAAPAPIMAGGSSLALLRPAAGADGTDEVLHELRASDDPGTWSVQSRGFEVSRRDGRPVLRLGGGRTSGPIRITRALSLDPAAGSRVRAWVAFEGEGTLVAEWLRAGQVVAESAPVPLVAGEGVTAVDLDLPPGGDAVGPCDGLALRCDGGYRRLDLAGLDVRRPSVASRLPRDGSWIVRDGVARPVQAVLPERPLTARVVLRPGQTLRAVATLPEGMAPAEQADQLAITLAWGDEALETLTPLSEGWVDAIVSSPSVEAGRLEVEVTLRAVGGACLIGPLRSSVEAPAPPTVVLVTAADHRGDHLGAAFRGVHVDTPALDALAGRGVLFADCQVSTNTTEGSLAALFTGTSPRDLGLLGPGAVFDRRVPSLAHFFRSAGWETLAALGGADVGPASGLLDGFDEARVVTAGLRRPADAVLAQALSLLDDRAGRPVFLWVHLADGSWPHEPDVALLDTYVDVEDDPRYPRFRELPPRMAATLPVPDRDVRDLEWLRARYKAVLTGMDRALGRFLESPRVSEATVAYVGVTGLALGDPETWFKRMGLHPGVLHVPLVLAGPGLPVDQRRRDPVSHLDLGRTLLELAHLGGVAFPGSDLLGDRASRPRRFAVESFGLSAAVTDGDRHLVTALRDRHLPYLLGRRQRGERELYRRGALDVPGENLAVDGGEGLAELSRALLRWLAEAPPFEPAPTRGLTDAELQRLGQLGYTLPLPVVPQRPWAVDGE